MLKRTILSAVAVGAILAAAPVLADEIEDNLNDALEAYAEGELQETKEILLYVTTLLESQSADAFGNFLPEAPDGWTRQVIDSSEEAAAMAMLGGGAVVEAMYSNDTGENVSVRILVDSPMAMMMGAQFSNPALLAQMGEVRRINRQQVLLSNDGDLQALVANRFLIQIEGSDDQDIHAELFEGIDIKALKAAQ